MQALNIKVGDTPEQTKPVHDSYKNRLDDVLDSYINDTVASTINTNLYPLTRIMSITQPRTLFDVPLSLWLFSEAANSKNKNSSPSAKRSFSPMLPASIMPKELSNPLLWPSSIYGKLRKENLGRHLYLGV